MTLAGKSEIQEFVFAPNAPTGREVFHLIKDNDLEDYELDSYLRELSNSMVSTGYNNYRYILKFRRRK